MVNEFAVQAGVAETFQTRILDVLPHLWVYWFSSLPPARFRDCISIGCDRFLPNPFWFIMYQSSCYSTPYIDSVMKYE
jgi:hypothetical protein